LSYVNQHLNEEGARYAKRSVELARPLPAAQDIVAGGLSILANALRYQGDLDGALRTIREARDVANRASYPNETVRLFNLYGPLIREGRILGERDSVNLDRPEEAAAVLQQAIDLNEEAAVKNAGDSASRGRIGSTARELGDILRDSNPRRALEVYDLG